MRISCITIKYISLPSQGRRTAASQEAITAQAVLSSEQAATRIPGDSAFGARSTQTLTPEQAACSSSHPDGTWHPESLSCSPDAVGCSVPPLQPSLEKQVENPQPHPFLTQPCQPHSRAAHSPCTDAGWGLKAPLYGQHAAAETLHQSWTHHLRTTCISPPQP